jgi:hypothetical protein
VSRRTCHSAPRPADHSDVSDAPAISVQAQAGASTSRLLAARCARSLLRASYVRQHRRIAQCTRGRAALAGWRLGAPAGSAHAAALGRPSWPCADQSGGAVEPVGPPRGRYQGTRDAPAAGRRDRPRWRSRARALPIAPQQPVAVRQRGPPVPPGPRRCNQARRSGRHRPPR